MNHDKEDWPARTTSNVNHVCHAENCKVQVPPKLLMCRRHWFMVPKLLRDRVWATYRPGQEIDKRPTREYLEAATAAIEAVYRRENPELFAGAD